MTGNRADCTWNHFTADENEMLSQTEALPMYQPHDNWLLFNQSDRCSYGGRSQTVSYLKIEKEAGKKRLHTKSVIEIVFRK